MAGGWGGQEGALGSESQEKYSALAAGHHASLQIYQKDACLPGTLGGPVLLMGHLGPGDTWAPAGNSCPEPKWDTGLHLDKTPTPALD